MNAKEKHFAARSITPDASVWTVLLTPIAANNVTIINKTTVDLLMRTDDTKSESEISIPVGESYVVAFPRAEEGLPRFIVDDPVAFFKLSASGSGSAKGVFVL